MIAKTNYKGKSNKIKVGDRIEVVGKKCATCGEKGTVRAVNKNSIWPYKVQLDGIYGDGEYAGDELRRV